MILDSGLLFCGQPVDLIISHAPAPSLPRRNCYRLFDEIYSTSVFLSQYFTPTEEIAHSVKRLIKKIKRTTVNLKFVINDAIAPRSLIERFNFHFVK